MTKQAASQLVTGGHRAREPDPRDARARLVTTPVGARSGGPLGRPVTSG